MHRSHTPIKREFAKQHCVFKINHPGLPAGSDDRDGDRQIKGSAFLAQVSRREIDRGAHIGLGETAVFERGKNTLAAFLHRRVRQAHQIENKLIAV